MRSLFLPTTEWKDQQARQILLAEAVTLVLIGTLFLSLKDLFTLVSTKGIREGLVNREKVLQAQSMFLMKMKITEKQGSLREELMNC